MGRPRNPEATKLTILEACLSCLASGGSDGVSLLQVTKIAGVNRSTIYDYYKNRENLIDQTIAWISGRLFRAVFGELETLGERPFENVDVVELNRRLVNFAMANPELCRVWLMQVLAMPDPTVDPFWREYEGSIERFARTEAARPNIDAEVFSVINLASAFLWPLRARAQSGRSGFERAAKRFVHEMVRLALYGAVMPESFPELAKVAAEAGARTARRKPAVRRAAGTK